MAGAWPQLAIVELMISGGRGAELCQRLKQHGAGAVLAVSVLEAGDQALASGADAFLQKPLDPRRTGLDRQGPARSERAGRPRGRETA